MVIQEMGAAAEGDAAGDAEGHAAGSADGDAAGSAEDHAEGGDEGHAAEGDEGHAAGGVEADAGVGADPAPVAVYWGLRALSNKEAAPARIRDIRLWTFILLSLNEFECEKLSLRSLGQAVLSMPGNYWTVSPKSRTSGMQLLW